MAVNLQPFQAWELDGGGLPSHWTWRREISLPEIILYDFRYKWNSWNQVVSTDNVIDVSVIVTVEVYACSYRSNLMICGP
jgi:hypothetical protein